MTDENNFESKQFIDALAQMRELELVRLLDIVETLAQDFRQNPIRDGESVAAAAAAQEFLIIWNNEVKRVLTMKHMKETAKSGR
ncbi:MAG: hypothetical protein H0X30_33620 [Anaerolineae bacterium]|nr:hypothetical protein [Anaerolineae bacterium]